jgi:Sec-independent protein translocase protein TatA
MFIVVVVLLLLGPDKLPEVAHKLGSSWRALKRIQERVESEVREVIPDLPSTGDLARMARSPVNMLNQLASRVDAKDEAAKAPETPTLAPMEPPIVPPETPPPSPRTDNLTLPPDPSLN